MYVAEDERLNPEDWGWQMKDNIPGKDKQLIPVYTVKPAAPDELLKTVCCGCKGTCDSMKCTCYKNGMKCTSACKECCGVSCNNVTVLTPISEDIMEEEEDGDELDEIV